MTIRKGSDADAGQDEAGADDPEEPVSETTLISLDQSKTAQMADSESYWLLTFTLSQPEDVVTAPAAASEETAPSVRTDVEEGETTDPSKVKADLTFTLPEGATEGLTIDIATTDIKITAKHANGEDVTSASFDIQPLELTLEPEPVPTFPESDQSATIPASGAIPDLSYTLSLDGVEDIDYWAAADPARRAGPARGHPDGGRNCEWNKYRYVRRPDGGGRPDRTSRRTTSLPL